MADKSVLFESRGTHYATKWSAASGRIELTPSRIIFYRFSPLFMLFGLVGALFTIGNKGTATLSIELANVLAFDRQRQGVTTKILNFTMKDGSSHRLLIEKFDPFLKELTQYFSSRHGLSQMSDNYWAVGTKNPSR